MIEQDHPEHKCDDCGGLNVIWYAPNKLWNLIVRRKLEHDAKILDSPEGADPMLCPLCFILRCESAGIELCWEIKPANWTPELFAKLASNFKSR